MDSPNIPPQLLYYGRKSQTILCGVCNKPVENAYTWRDEKNMATWFVVECHGDRELVNVNDSEIFLATSVSFGKAFINPKILPESTK